jgi:hemoglobin
VAESPISEPTAGKPWGAAETPYEEIGGDETVRAIAEAFYDIIEAESPTLRAMLPDDTSGSRHKLYQFLSGWMGGPPLYWEAHGHPRLRLRHVPFPIDRSAAEEWSRCMTAAIESVAIGDKAAGFLTQQLSTAALTLINR